MPSRRSGEKHFGNKTAGISAVKLKEDSFTAQRLVAALASTTAALLSFATELKGDNDGVPQ